MCSLKEMSLFKQLIFTQVTLTIYSVCINNNRSKFCDIAFIKICLIVFL